MAQGLEIERQYAWGLGKCRDGHIVIGQVMRLEANALSRTVPCSALYD
jgi:hypothetical protein